MKVIEVDFTRDINNTYSGLETKIIFLSGIQRSRAIKKQQDLKNQNLAFTVAKERKVISKETTFQEWLFMKESSIDKLSQQEQQNIDNISEKLENIRKSVNKINNLIGDLKK
jgi:enoyl-[acyl-carrier-protein] reductase (NADH)